MSNKNFVYNLQAGVFAGQNDVIWTVCLHKELILYSGSDSGRLVAWNAATCQPIGSMMCQFAQGTVTQLGAKNLVLAAAGDRVIVTEVLPNGQFAPVRFATMPVLNPTVPRGAPGSVLGAVCMHVEDLDLWVGYSDGFVRQWQQGRLVREFKIHAGVVMTLDKRDGTLFSGGQDQTVYAMDVREGKPFALYRGQHGPIRALNVYGNKLCIGTGNAIRVQTVDQGELLQRLCGHTHPIFSMIRDRHILYSGSGDRKVFVWNLDTLWPMMEIHTGHQGRVKTMALSAQGMLFTGSSDKLIKKFNMKDAFAKYEVYKKQNPDAQHSGVAPPPSRSVSSRGGARGGANGGGTMTAGMLSSAAPPVLSGHDSMSTQDLADLLPALPGDRSAKSPPASAAPAPSLARSVSATELPAPPARAGGSFGRNDFRSPPSQLSGSFGTGDFPAPPSHAGGSFGRSFSVGGGRGAFPDNRTASVPSGLQHASGLTEADDQQYGNLRIVQEGSGMLPPPAPQAPPPRPGGGGGGAGGPPPTLPRSLPSLPPVSDFGTNNSSAWPDDAETGTSWPSGGQDEWESEQGSYANLGVTSAELAARPLPPVQTDSYQNLPAAWAPQ